MVASRRGRTREGCEQPANIANTPRASTRPRCFALSPASSPQRRPHRLANRSWGSGFIRREPMADMLSDFDGWMKLSELVQSALTLLALCATRVYALAMVFPPMGEQSLTGVIRNAVCLMIA